MSKKYFLCSDIHSFYTELMTALIKKGFDRMNPDHVLVVLGDVFDRGKETLNVYNFLRSLPDDRLILVKGNHECLYLELLKKHFPESYDFSNGTVRTFCQIAGFDEKVVTYDYWFKQARKEGLDVWTYESKPLEYWLQIREIVETSPVTAWIKSDKWVNMFETPNYVCVHSWIPLSCVHNMWEYFPTPIGPREDWKNATQTEWEDAMWVCPWRMAKNKWNNTGKTIICGHWHTSDFFNNLTRQETKQRDNNPIFKSKRYKLIGLDACTALSKKINVLVLDEDEI